MARGAKRLTASEVKALKSPGWYADGEGLYVRVDVRRDGDGRETINRRWIFVWRRGTKRSEMGLGSAAQVSLADARAAAQRVRQALQDGIDPIAARRTKKASAGLETFGAFADRLIEDLAPGWKNQKHIAQWRMTLAQHAAGLRPKALDQIGTEDVLDVLKPLWSTKPETATRLRGRIERVLDAAKAAGLRTGENPARWRGHLSHLLPKPKKLTRGHQKAMPASAVPGFIGELRARPSVSALALEFTILTAVRTNEVVRLHTREIALDRAVWTVPAGRAKKERELRIPLTARALAILKQCWPDGGDGYVFRRSVYAKKRGKTAPAPHMSEAAMYELLKGMRDGLTVHGFRSSFRDWVGDETEYPRELAEHALGHIVGDESEQAYRRGDALERRRALMDAWARHCEGEKKSGKVVPIR